MSDTAIQDLNSLSSSECRKSESFLQEFGNLIGNIDFSRFLSTFQLEKSKRRLKINGIVVFFNFVVLFLYCGFLGLRSGLSYYCISSMVISGLYYFWLAILTKMKKNPLEYRYRSTMLFLDYSYGISGFLFLILSDHPQLPEVVCFVLAATFYLAKIIFRNKLPIVNSILFLLSLLGVYIGGCLTQHFSEVGIISVALVFAITASALDCVVNIRKKEVQLTKLSPGIFHTESHLQGLCYLYNSVLNAYPTYDGSIIVSNEELELKDCILIRFSIYNPLCDPHKTYFVLNDEILLTFNCKFVIWIITKPKYANLVSLFDFKTIIIVTTQTFLEKKILQAKSESVQIEFSGSLESIREYIPYCSTLSRETELLRSCIENNYLEMSPSFS
eukprot:NODE_14_length_51535_cov_1.125049.p14 type:complete len:387 gc:universal NODE_14_length_51535_cov_1.125049:41879-40719(-)